MDQKKLSFPLISSQNQRIGQFRLIQHQLYLIALLFGSRFFTQIRVASENLDNAFLLYELVYLVFLMQRDKHILRMHDDFTKPLQHFVLLVKRIHFNKA